MVLKHACECFDQWSVVCPQLEIASFQDVPEMSYSYGGDGGEEFPVKR
jgi:hypothetical protein